MNKRSKTHYEKDVSSGDVLVKIPPELLQKGVITKSPRDALRELHQKLAENTVLFLEHGDSGRAGTIRALIDTLQYFVSVGVPHAVLLPLQAPLEALVDSGNGAGSKLFAPVRDGNNSGRPPLTIRQLEFEGRLALVVDCCVSHCKNQGLRPYLGPACQLASRLINASVSGDSYSPNTLKKLRERVLQRPKNSTDRVAFEASRENEAKKTDPLKFAKDLLSFGLIDSRPKQQSS